MYKDPVYKVAYMDSTGANDTVYSFATQTEAEQFVKADVESTIKAHKDQKMRKWEFENRTDIWEIDGDFSASWLITVMTVF